MHGWGIKGAKEVRVWDPKRHVNSGAPENLPSWCNLFTQSPLCSILIRKLLSYGDLITMFKYLTNRMQGNSIGSVDLDVLSKSGFLWFENKEKPITGSKQSWINTFREEAAGKPRLQRWGWETELDLIPGSATCYLCDLRKTTWRLWVSIFSSERW